MTRPSVARFLSIACIAAVAAVALPGCGKPEFCAKKTEFNSSVTTLTSVSLTPPDPTEISNEISNVQSAGTAMINSAQSDFPSQSSALENAVNDVVATGKTLETSTDLTATGVTLAAQLLVLNSAWNSFKTATNDACS
jgi:PBP1b-binding outer membrane lipoprotein LpoB